MRNDKGTLVAGLFVFGILAWSGLARAEGAAVIPLDDQRNPSQMIEGRCRFHGEFAGDGKGNDGFAVNCRAHLEFEKRELKMDATGPLSDGGHFRVECDDEELYEDGLKVTTEEGRRRGMEVTFSGQGRHAPEIVIAHFRRDGGEIDSDPMPARLNFHRWGYAYDIPGRCEFRKMPSVSLN